MWQIQWAINLIPTSVLIWIYMMILGTGVFLYFGSKLAARWPFRLIPVVGQYRIASEIIGVVLMVLGIYLYGGYGTEMEWRNRVAEMEAKVAKSEAESRDANVKLADAVKEKNRAIQDNKAAVQAKLKSAAVRIDAECKLDPEAVEILNDSAKDIRKAKK